MSNVTEQENRRTRRRFVLLWCVPLVVLVLVLSAGAIAWNRDGSAATPTVGASGTGTAPVLDSPPVDTDEPEEPLTTRSPGATSASTPESSRNVATRNAEGGAALAPTPRASSTAALGPPRAHGASLALSSTLSQPLRPGFERQLYITVRNPNPFAVDLYRLDVRVDEPSAAGCLADWVDTGHYRYGGGTPRRVEPNGTVVVNLPIQLVNLVDVDQNACQNTAFPLRLSGVAVDSE